MKIGLFGFGKLGREIARLSPHPIVETYTSQSSIDTLDADIYIDVSLGEAVMPHLDLVSAAGKSLVIGTTGWEKELPAAKALVHERGTGALFAPNFSIGMALFVHILHEAAPLLAPYTPSGVEKHHAQKKDAPSGTAKNISRKLGGVPFTWERKGKTVGTHSVIFEGLHDTLTFTHEALDRTGFAEGALKCAEWLLGKTGWYTIDDMVGTLHSAHHALQK